MRTPEPKQVPSEYQSVLESPVEFSMQNGEVTEIQVSQNEPEWTVNIKKALIALLKVQTPTGRPGLSDNSIRGGDVTPNQWRVMEQGVDGRCENTYQVTELPEYMLQEIEISGEPLRVQGCQGKKVFEVLKTRDVNKCTERTAYQVSQPGQYLCPTGNCNGMWQRSSITRYIACGTSEENMELQAIVNVGELNQSLLGYNTENTVTGTMQILKLVAERRSMRTLPRIETPRKLEGLFYNYPTGKTHETLGRREQQQRLQEQNLETQRPLGLSESVLSKLSPATLQKKIVEQVLQVVKDLHNVENFAKKQVAANVLSTSKVFSLLNTQQMKSLYQEVKGMSVISGGEKEAARQLVVEIAIMTGTSPAIMLVKELIESHEISPLRAGVAIVTLPHYVRTPTVKLLEQLFELVKSPVVSGNELLKANSELAFATLVNRACVDGNRYSRFPIFVYGEFCNSQTSELTSKYIPYLVNQLQSSRNDEARVAAILSIGALGHESVISILLPYIEGRTSGSTPEQQRMAIYSLYSVTRQHSNVLLPVYSAIVHNPSEDRNVRIAALSMMMYMEPSMVHFQKLATSTWFEKDNEFHKFVFSTLKSLSEIKMAEQPNSNTVLYNIAQKARVVLPLAKAVPITITSSVNYFTAEWLKDLQVGYHVHTAYTVGNYNTIYGRLEYFLESLNFVPLEFAAHVQGTGKFVEKINKIFGTQGKSILDKIHPEWREMISALDIQKLESSPFGAGIWAKLFDDVQVVGGLNMRHVEPMLQNLEQFASEPRSLKGKLCGKHPINMVKVNNWAPTEILIPSDMGLPIVMEVQMPAVLALRGEVEIECSGSLPAVSVELTSKADVAFTGYVGTICPFTKEIVAAGINQQWSVNYPTKVSAKVEMGRFQIKYSQNEEAKQSTQSVDVLAYSVKPFATIKPFVYADVTPLIVHQNTKIIKSEAERKTMVVPALGQYYGIDSKLVINTETDIRDMKSLIDHLALYKYNPVNIALFSWTNTAVTRNGMPSARFHEVKMVYNPSTSSTKEIEVDFTIAMAHKSKSQGIKAIQLLSQQQLQTPRQQNQKIQQVLENLQIESGLGLTSELNVVFKGNQEKTFSYVLSAGQGRQGSQQKWNLHLQNKDRMSFCMDGSVTLPSLAIRDIERLESENVEFTYRNNIGFGQTCQEHTIKVTGSSNVSQQQKEKIQQSEEVRKCIRSSEKIQEIREELQRTRIGSQQHQQLEEQQQEAFLKKIDHCEQAIRKMSTLDQAKFRIEYTQMPQYVRQYTRILDTAVKAMLLPYVVRSESTSNQHNQIEVELKFNTHLETVDMVLREEDETNKYANIRLPERVRNIIPFVASKSIQEQLIERIEGGSVYPKCYIGNGAIKTFDNKTYSYELDDCYHVLAADCSKQTNHAVLGKLVGGKKHVQIFTRGSKITLKPARSYSESRKEYEINVDGQPITLNRNQKEEVQSRDGESSYNLYR